MPTITNPGLNSPLSRAEIRKGNPEAFNPIINGRALRPPIRNIFIYSVARRSFPIRDSLIKFDTAACEPGERYVLCTTISDPILQSSPDQERGGTRIDDNDAWIHCIDMLNPGNFTLDPYAGSTNPTFFANINGTNLISEGIWPSLNNPPTEQEIKRAEDCRDKRYRYLTREALRLGAISTKQLNEFIQRWPDVHMAMDALGLEASWHQKNEIKATCPNCGDSISPGQGFHKSSVTDRLCVIDPRKAYQAKAITRDEYEELTGEKLPGRRASAEAVSA